MQLQKTEFIKDAIFFPEIAAQIVSRFDIKSNTLETIIKNKTRAIRCLPKDSNTLAFLTVEVTKIGTTFTGKEPDTLVVRECVKAMQGEFKALSMPEIWEAFRCHAAGVLEDEKGKGETFGKLTAKSFIAVLAVWVKHKSSVEAAYIKAVHRVEQEKEDAERAEKAKAVFWPTLKETIRKLRHSECTYQDCPVYIFDTLRKNGLIHGLEKKEVWSEIWQRAQSQARIDLIATEQALTARGGVRLVGDVAKANIDASVDNAAKTIAKKIALFDLVVKNFQFDIDFVTDGLTL